MGKEDTKERKEEKGRMNTGKNNGKTIIRKLCKYEERNLRTSEE